METRLIKENWGEELAALAEGSSSLRIICPFIKDGALAPLLTKRQKKIQVITRFNLSDFSQGVSDIDALKRLLKSGAEVRGVKHLHAKIYVFGKKHAVVTSANLTRAAMFRNHEFGVVSEDKNIVDQCNKYFDDIWRQTSFILTSPQLNRWNKTVNNNRESGGKNLRAVSLGDYGDNISSMPTAPLKTPGSILDAPQAFVKFLGRSEERVPVNFETIEEIRRAGCHWALCYPQHINIVQDGAIMYIARLTDEPDIRIFGRAIGMKHVRGEDEATEEEMKKEHRAWKEEWPYYIRVHHAEFLDGVMGHGVSFNKLKKIYGPESFTSTMRRIEKGEKVKDVGTAYRRKPAVQLSPRSWNWLEEKLQKAFKKHGCISQRVLSKID